MKPITFWKKLIIKIYDKIEHDKLLYGDSFIEITYDKTGMIENIKFDGGMMQDKIIQK